jgi:hypothetical protein
MPDSPTPDPPKSLPPKLASTRGLLALRSHRISIGLPALYEAQLRESIFPRLADDKRKPNSAFRKVLSNFGTFHILQLIWKESSFLEDAEIEACGLVRLFGGEPLTCHGLARLMAVGSEDRVEAINKRLSKIVRASVAYELIEEERVAPTKIFIKATSLLDNFMHQLSEAQRGFLDEHYSQLAGRSTSRGV